MKMAFDLTYRIARRIVVALVGASVLLVGVIMIVTPGPAVVVIPTGLAILGLEFAWARRWLHRVRDRLSEESRRRFNNRVEARRSGPSRD